jgi:hypothetical protein
MKMKSTWARYVLLTVLALCLGALAWAAQEKETKTKSGKSMTVTGCLQKGDEAGEYSLTGDDGKRYGLHTSGSLDLSKHLGHTVTVTGTKMHEENETKEKHEAGGAEAADLRVTNVKHVSETCQ